MADDKTTHAQHDTTFPFRLPAMPMFGAEIWKQAAEAWIGRVVAMTEEATKVESLGADRARAAIDGSARLARESLDYTLNLSAEWRKLMMESVRQALGGSTPTKQG